MDSGRAEYFAATDQEALDAFQLVSRLEGIIPALETSHAFAYLEVSCSLSSMFSSEFRELYKQNGIALIQSESFGQCCCRIYC